MARQSVDIIKKRAGYGIVYPYMNPEDYCIGGQPKILYILFNQYGV